MNKIRRVHLRRSEVEYVKRAGFLPLTLLESLQDVQWRSEDAGTVELSVASAEQFRDAFTEQLARVGFDETYEPTAEGKLLENLIDRFRGGDLDGE